MELNPQSDIQNYDVNNLIETIKITNVLIPPNLLYIKHIQPDIRFNKAVFDALCEKYIGKSDKTLGYIFNVSNVKIIDNIIDHGYIMITASHTLQTIIPKVGVVIKNIIINIMPNGIFVDNKQLQLMIIGGTFIDNKYIFNCKCMYKCGDEIYSQIKRFVFKQGVYTCICIHVCKQIHIIRQSKPINEWRKLLQITK